MSTSFPSDLIDHFKLEVDFRRDHVSHTSYTSDHARGLRKKAVEKKWYRRGVIGEGACGTVWLEVHQEGKGTAAERAVKEIRKSRMRAFQIDFRRELLAIAKLSKECSNYYRDQGLFVNLFGWFDNDDAVFLAMEYFPCGDLAKHIPNGFTEDETKTIATQLLEGLEIMHANDFAHRDLKPQNIFVVSKSPVWWIKIGDFGISKRAENEVTNFRTEVGTRPYQAPEILGIIEENDQGSNYTNAVDIWSLGCVCFQLLTGGVPFPNRRALERFCSDQNLFPTASLTAKVMSVEGIDFVKSLMVPLPSERFTANTALHTSWLEQAQEPLGWKGAEGEIEIVHRPKGSEHLNLVDEMLAKEINDNSSQQKIPGILGGNGVSAKSHEQDQKATEAKNKQASIIIVDSFIEISTVDLASINPRKGVPEVGDDASTILPLPLHRFQVTGQNGSQNGAEHESQTETQSQAVGIPAAYSETEALLLLQLGFDVNLDSFNKEKALLVAAEQGNETVVQILLDRGADIDAMDSSGAMALHLASVKGHLHVVKMLIERGAHIEAAAHSGSRVIHFAAFGGSEKVIQLLLEKEVNFNACGKGGKTALHFAASQGSLAIVQLLLEKGSNIETVTDHGNRALHYAGGRGHVEVVRLLLEKGANIEATDGQGGSTLHVAAEQGFATVVQLLLEKGSNIEGYDMYGETPLYHAGGRGHVEVVRLLLEKGANIEATDGQGGSTLHRAAGGGFATVVQLLLENGAETEKESGESRWTPLHIASWGGHVKVVQLLLENGAETEKESGESRWRPLHIASGRGHMKVLQLLLENGAYVKAKDSNGLTALDMARFKNHMEASVLLSQWARPSFLNIVRKSLTRRRR